MRFVRHAALLLAPLFALAHSASTAAIEWSLPAGVSWHTADGKCQPAGVSFPFMKGCYFGASGTEENGGVAFFRICGATREARPFLIADFERKRYFFDKYIDGGHIEEGPLELSDPSSPLSYSIDPSPFFVRAVRLVGSCWLTGSPV